METFLLQQLYICRLLHTLQSYVRIFKCVYCGNGAWVLLFLTADAKWFDGVSWWDRNKRRNQCCVFQKCYSFFVNHAARHPHSLLLFSSVFLFLQTFFLQVVVSSLLSASFSLSHAQSCVQERYTFTSWQQAWGCRWNYTISHMHTLTRTHTQQSNLPQYTAEKQSLSCCNSASRPLPPVLCWHTRTHTHMHRHTHTHTISQVLNYNAANTEKHVWLGSFTPIWCPYWCWPKARYTLCSSRPAVTDQMSLVIFPKWQPCSAK